MIFFSKFVNWIVREYGFFQKNFEIYTDGSHKGKWGSWAFVVVCNQKILHEASGRENKTNSHRMEFQAAIEAMKYLPKNSRALFYTDSRVLLNSVNKKNKRVEVNLEQVEELKRLSKNHKISWRWVKAHSGTIYNERCDQLCILARTFTDK